MRGRSFAPTIVIASAFLGYFALLVYCDLSRPEGEGLRFAFDGPHIKVTSVIDGSPAARAGFRIDDSLISWNGQPLDTKVDWAAVQANYEIGRAMRFEVERDGRVRALALTLAREPPGYWRSGAGLSLLAVRTIQVVTLGFGLLIALRRPEDPAARLGAWVLASAGVFCFVLPYQMAAVWRGLPFLLGASLWLPYLSSLVIAALLFSFFQVFPRRSIRARWWWALVWTPMAVAAVPHLSHALRMVYRPESMTAAPDVMLAIVIVSLGYLVAAIVLPTRAYRRLDDPTERRRVRVLVLGSAIGGIVAVPLVVGFWLTDRDTLLFGSPVFAAGTFIALAVPLSFAYAILRHRLFDIRVIIRQGIRYALARWTLRAIVPASLLMFVADVALHRTEPVASLLRMRLVAYLALGGFAVFASLHRHRWTDALDRRFFRDRYDARQVLGRVVEEVHRQGTLDAAASQVVGRVEAALHAEYVALVDRPIGAPRFAVVSVSPATASPYVPHADGAVVGILCAVQKPIEIGGAIGSWLDTQLSVGELDGIRAGRVELIVPITVEPGQCGSFLVLGPKRSEEPYTADDIELVSTVARSLALVAARRVTASTGDAGMEACPTCGSCHDSGTGSCPEDGTRLAALAVPRLLNGRYRIETRLARGGMGTVYAARDTALDRMVAVKVIRAELVGDSEALERFGNEARVAATFSHPNVVTVFDTGVAAGQHAYLVMELLRGDTLRERLRSCRQLEPARALPVLRGIASAVDAAHGQGILHRDLKPENVLLVARDGEDVAKVLDFGIAKLIGDDAFSGRHETTAFGAFVGTPLYMAPEQLRGEAARPAWDLWALAVIAFETLAGVHPFLSRVGPDDLSVRSTDRGADARQSAMSASVRRLFDRALALDPGQRPGSALVLVRELETAIREGAGEK